MCLFTDLLFYTSIVMLNFTRLLTDSIECSRMDTFGMPQSLLPCHKQVENVISTAVKTANHCFVWVTSYMSLLQRVSYAVTYILDYDISIIL